MKMGGIDNENGKEQAHWIYKTMNEIRFLKKRYTKFLVMVEFQDSHTYM